MKIKIEEYRNNLLFYTILKNIIKCKLRENKLEEFENYIKENINLGYNKLIEFLKMQIVRENVKTYEDYLILINLCDEDNYDMWCDLTILSIELLLCKNLILAETKTYAKTQYSEDIENIKDKLSFNYDLINLEYPYGQRVINALLVYALTNTNRKNEFILESSGKVIKKLNNLIINISNKYSINANNVFMIIMDESINQSIISTAGSSYESRVESVLLNISDNVRPHVHDKNITSVEYDYTFELDGKVYGVSAKRTLRERYKQNFEDVHQLSVEAVFLITLGIDLNEEKLNNIMQRHGYFIVVSQEMYNSQSYFKKNKRVISSENFNADNLRKLFSQYV